MQEIIAAFGLDWKILLVNGLNFGLLLFVLWYFLYAPVMRMLEERRERVARGVQDAEEATAKLSLAEGEVKKMLTGAGKEAEELLSKARKHGAEKERELLAAAQGKSDQVLKEAQALAEEERRKALESSK